MISEDSFTREWEALKENTSRHTENVWMYSIYKEKEREKTQRERERERERERDML